MALRAASSVVRGVGQRAAASPLITAPQLAERLKNPASAQIKIIDASWSLADGPSFGADSFRAKRAAGSVFFDIDACVDPDLGHLPHMLPSKDDSIFEKYMTTLGISPDDDVVVLDRSGQFVASARVWWTLRSFGHQGEVRVLDGGLFSWEKEGLPVASGRAEDGTAGGITPYRVNAKTKEGSWTDLYVGLAADVDAAVASGRQVLDARPGERFRCEVPEPRPGVRRGTIPTSVSLPHLETLRKVDETAEGTAIFSILPEGDLKAVLKAAGCDWTRPSIVSCGSGVNAAVVSLAMATLKDAPVTAVYDGSWADYGAEA